MRVRVVGGSLRRVARKINFFRRSCPSCHWGFSRTNLDTDRSPVPPHIHRYTRIPLFDHPPVSARQQRQTRAPVLRTSFFFYFYQTGGSQHYRSSSRKKNLEWMRGLPRGLRGSDGMSPHYSAKSPRLHSQLTCITCTIYFCAVKAWDTM